MARKNPPLVIFANGRRKIGAHVQAIVYVHAQRGVGPRVHGFGDAELSERELQRGVLQLSRLHQTTDVCMFGNPDGSITIQHAQGKRLWDSFPDEE